MHLSNTPLSANFQALNTIQRNVEQPLTDYEALLAVDEPDYDGPPATNLEVALALSRAGFPVFPCRPDKRPLVTNWHNAATADLKQISRWWRQYPDALPGLPCGARSGLAVLDLDLRADGRDGEAALQELGFAVPAISPVRVSTPSGGLHIYLRWHEGLTNVARHLPEGVDARGEGGYVIAPGASLPDGRRYGSAALSRDLPAWPEALLSPKREFDFEAMLRDDLPVEWARVDSALAAISPDCSRDDWRNIGMAIHAANSSDAGFERWDRWSATGEKYDGRKILLGQWKSFGRKAGIGVGTLFHLAAAHGWSDPEREISADDFDDLPPIETLPTVGDHVVKSKSGAPLATLSNAVAFVLRLDRQIGGLDLRLDLMTGNHTWKDGETSDSFVDRLRMAVERSGMPNASNDLIQRAVSEVARRNAYHPVRDDLARAEWDGQERLSHMLPRYFGSKDSSYTSAVGRATLIAMVARVMKPGCKHDHALILIGEQGTGKSTACRVLAGQDRWFSDSLPRIHGDSKEARLHLAGKWLVELGELSSMRKAEADDLKAFITTAADKVRRPYARRDESLPRQCIFVGTTNSEEFLRDETGGRRFWPVMTGKIDLATLARDRDQLFAEAVAAYHAGEQWHLPPEIEALARVEQAKAREPDAWEESIRGWLDAGGFDDAPRNMVRVTDVLRSCIEMPRDRQTVRETRRVGAVMRALGWQKHKDGNGNMVWKRP